MSARLSPVGDLGHRLSVSEGVRLPDAGGAAGEQQREREPRAPEGRADGEVVERHAFQADGGWRKGGGPSPKGSDGALMKQLVAARGLTFPAEFLGQRMVWVDEGGRDELMFIYLEDLAPQHLTTADLEPGGKAASRAAEVKRALLARAAAGIRLQR